MSPYDVPDRFYRRPPRRPELPPVPRRFWKLYELRLARWKAHYRNGTDRHNPAKTRRRIVWALRQVNAVWPGRQATDRDLQELADLHAHYSAISDWV